MLLPAGYLFLRIIFLTWTLIRKWHLRPEVYFGQESRLFILAVELNFSLIQLLMFELDGSPSFLTSFIYTQIFFRRPGFHAFRSHHALCFVRTKHNRVIWNKFAHAITGLLFSFILLVPASM